VWHNVQEAYTENRVLEASPVELIGLLYEAAMESLMAARRHLAAGDIRERSHAINRACGILLELDHSLDHAAGGELSGRLAQLYEYMNQRLIEANFQQADAPLAEVLGLLATLAEGWDGVRRQVAALPAQPATPAPQAWTPAPADPVSSHAWSL
jgi:flagellar protein FliS